MDKYIIAYLDSKGNIVDYVSANNSHDLILAIAEELTLQRGEQITPYHAKVVVDQRYGKE